MNLLYTYVRYRLNNTPNIVSNLTNFGRIITWIPSMLAWALNLGEIYQYQNCLGPEMVFTGTENQEVLTAFDTSTWFSQWDSGYTNSINAYFELYTEYKTLDPGDYTQVNGIGGIIKPQGIGIIVLSLE